MAGAAGRHTNQVHPSSETSESMNPGVSVQASPAASTSTPSVQSPSKRTIHLLPLPAPSKKSEAYGGEEAFLDQQPGTLPRDRLIDVSNGAEGGAEGGAAGAAGAPAGSQGNNKPPLKMKSLPPELQGLKTEKSVQVAGTDQKTDPSKVDNSGQPPPHEGKGKAESSAQEEVDNSEQPPPHEGVGKAESSAQEEVDNSGQPPPQEWEGKADSSAQEESNKQKMGPRMDSGQKQKKEKEKLQKEVEELQKAYRVWLNDCCSKFKEERHDRETIIFGIPWESIESYVMKLSVWMRETGGPMQTEHPIWRAIIKFDEEIKAQKIPEYEKKMREWVKSIGCPDDVQIDDIEKALLDLVDAEEKDDEHEEHDWRSKLDEIKKEHEKEIEEIKKCYTVVEDRSQELYRMVKALPTEILTSLDGKKRKLGE